MLDLAHAFELIVHGLYHQSLTQHYPVLELHQHVLHIVPDGGDQVYAINEKEFGQFLSDIALVSIEFSPDVPEEFAFLERFAVIHMCLCDHEVQYLSPFIDDQMELEAMEPSHGGSSRSCHSFEHLIGLDTFVLAHPQRGGIGK